MGPATGGAERERSPTVGSPDRGAQCLATGGDCAAPANALVDQHREKRGRSRDSGSLACGSAAPTSSGRRDPVQGAPR